MLEKVPKNLIFQSFPEISLKFPQNFGIHTSIFQDILIINFLKDIFCQVYGSFNERVAIQFWDLKGVTDNPLRWQWWWWWRWKIQCGGRCTRGRLALVKKLTKFKSKNYPNGSISPGPEYPQAGFRFGLEHLSCTWRQRSKNSGWICRHFNKIQTKTNFWKIWKNFAINVLVWVRLQFWRWYLFFFWKVHPFKPIPLDFTT